MHRTSVALATAAMMLAPAAPIAGAHQGQDDGVTAVTELSGAPVAGGMEISGTAAFGGQHPVIVSDDPPGDGPGMVPAGDENGVDEAGIDLLIAALSVPDPDTPELLVQWLLSKLPPGGLPEGTRVSLPFRIGEDVYRVQAKFSNIASTSTPDDPTGHATHTGGAFQLLGDCTESLQGTGLPHCDHLAWLEGDFDATTTTISVRVPLGSAVAPAIDFGAALRRNDSDAGELRDALAGYQAVVAAEPMNDLASFGPPGQEGYAFPIPQKEVTLGIAPKGTDPGAVEFSAAASLASDDTFTGTISTGGFEAGTFDVYARACFATNCGIRSLDGLEVVGDQAVAALRLGGDTDRSFAFWPGGHIGSKLEHSLPHPFFGPGPFVASCDNSPCFEYTLRVESPGAERLRIAIDTSKRSHNFTTQVTAPDDRSFSADNNNAFNAEIFVDDPPVGDYEILVRPFSAENTTFSMRAKLEAAVPTFAPDGDGRLLPDLRPTPPYELGFAAPVAHNGLFPPDDVNPPGDVGGAHPLSCTPDETVDDEVVRCLRFSFGLSNHGHGKFSVRWSQNLASQPPGPVCGDNASVGCAVPANQCIERPGQAPEFEQRPAGEAQLHYTHGHDHYKDIIFLELFRVTDPESGTMEPVGDGRKIGYSPANQAFSDWFAFDQRTGAGSSVPGCPSGGGGVGMQPGWGDVYRYQRPGNWVNFGTNPDGLYVIRLTADPVGNVLESNEGNNASYTYVRLALGAVVAGDEIEILEQGRGQSPWDPNKEILQPRYRDGVPW